jgi:predicted acyltransferase
MADLSVQPTSMPAPVTPARPVSHRLVSLDAFRGITMMLMVLVNDAGGGGGYHALQHSAWDGWTITDTVFPSFLWIVGVAITLSLGKRLSEGADRRRLTAQIFRRSVILYAFGLLIYAFPHFDLSTQRILGVLQRIAICYFICSIIYMTTSVRGQLIWIGSLLTGYWMLMTLVPVPGYGSGHLDVAGNFAHYIDRIVLGRHNYASTQTWDPEGIVSTLPAIATTLLGIMAGHILRLRRDLSERTTWLFLTGSLLLAAGMICNTWLPINKHLWTDSFTLFMAGLDFIVFAGFVWCVDGLGYKRIVKPLVIMGMNAITIYMASELLATVLSAIHLTSGESSISLHHWIFATIFAPLASPANASLLYALAYTGLMYLLAYALYRKRWFLKV